MTSSGEAQGRLSSQQEESCNKIIDWNEAGDSGFLSGPCTTESDLSSMSRSGLMSTSDLGSSTHSTLSHSEGTHPYKGHSHKPSSSSLLSSSRSTYSRLDSGVDVDLSVSESLSGLNIQEEGGHCLEVVGGKGQEDQIKGQNLPSWEYFFSPDEDGDTQLHLAIMQGNESFVFGLISLIPHPSILDFQNNLLQTALHVAVLCGAARIVRRLVAAGARVEMRDRKGNTPLHLAAFKGDLQCLQALSSALSSVELNEVQTSYPPFAQPLPQLIDATNYEGQGAIHLGAMGGHCDILRALHWLGTEVNLREGKGGRTPLHYAVERNQTNALLVLANECRVDLEVENYAGLTAYQIACGGGEGSGQGGSMTSLLRRAGAIPHPLPMEDDSSDDSDRELDQIEHQHQNNQHFNNCINLSNHCLS